MRFPEGKNRFSASRAPFHNERLVDFLIEYLTLEVVKLGFSYVKTALTHFWHSFHGSFNALGFAVRDLLGRRLFRRCFRAAKSRALASPGETELGG